MAPRYRLVAFDFDGVLADSAGWVIDALPALSAKFGLRPLSREDIEALRHKSNREIVRHMRAPAWKMPFIAAHFRGLYEREAGAIAAFDGARELLAAVADTGAGVAIVTSNGEAAVRAVLGEAAMARVGTLDTGIGLFGKAARLKRLARRLGVGSGEAIYVGDETRDMEAAHAAGYASAAATWGYASAGALAACRPTITASSPAALQALLL